MKCPKCIERAGQVRYIRTVTVKAAGGKAGSSKRYGLITVPVGECYIGETVKVVVERAREVTDQPVCTCLTNHPDWCLVHAA